MRAQLLVLAIGPGGGATVDLDSGALLRAHWTSPPTEHLRPFDVIDVVVKRDENLPFPQDTILTSAPVKVGRLSGRKADRLLKPLVHPVNRPLLGAPAPYIPYWTIRDDQPSITLVAPSAGPAVERDQRFKLRCRFRWRRLDHDLPLDDPLVDERLSHPTATQLAGGTLARALGWRPHRLIVTLTPPHNGQCAKVVASLLPKP